MLDCDSAGANCVTVATGSVTANPWAGSGAWTARTVDFGSINYSMAADRTLRVKIVVAASSDGDLWFAYDTTSYGSVFEVD